jgi:hypothetical protein
MGKRYKKGADVTKSAVSEEFSSYKPFRFCLEILNGEMKAKST